MWLVYKRDDQEQLPVYYCSRFHDHRPLSRQDNIRESLKVRGSPDIIVSQVQAPSWRPLRYPCRYKFLQNEASGNTSKHPLSEQDANSRHMYVETKETLSPGTLDCPLFPITEWFLVRNTKPPIWVGEYLTLCSQLGFLSIHVFLIFSQSLGSFLLPGSSQLWNILCSFFGIGCDSFLLFPWYLSQVSCCVTEIPGCFPKICENLMIPLVAMMSPMKVIVHSEMMIASRWLKRIFGVWNEEVDVCIGKSCSTSCAGVYINDRKKNICS